MPRWLNLPNFLTILRLAMAPFVIVVILNRQPSAALALFAIAAATDALDGALARHFQMTTPLGTYLDPIADKVLLSGVYIALAAIHSIPWWFVGIVFGRDLFILVSSCAAICFTKVRRFQPSIWGKASTALQVVTAVVWMTREVVASPTLSNLAWVLIWPTAAAAIWSGIHYGWRGLRMVRAH